MSRETVQAVLMKSVQDIFAHYSLDYRADDYREFYYNKWLLLVDTFLQKLELLYKTGHCEDIIHQALIYQDTVYGDTFGHLMMTSFFAIRDQIYARRYLKLLEDHASPKNLIIYLEKQNHYKATMGHLLFGYECYINIFFRLNYLDLLKKISLTTPNDLLRILTAKIEKMPIKMNYSEEFIRRYSNKIIMLKESLIESICRYLYLTTDELQYLFEFILPLFTSPAASSNTDQLKFIFNEISRRYGYFTLNLISQSAEKNPLLIIQFLKSKIFYTREISFFYDRNETNLRKNLLRRLSITQQIHYFLSQNPQLSHFLLDEALTSAYIRENSFLVSENTISEIADTAIRTSLLHLINHIPEQHQNLILWHLLNTSSNFSSYLESDLALSQRIFSMIPTDYTPPPLNAPSAQPQPQQPSSTTKAENSCSNLLNQFIEINFSVVKSNANNALQIHLLSEIDTIYSSLNQSNKNDGSLYLSSDFLIYHLYQENFEKFLEILKHYSLSEIIKRLPCYFFFYHNAQTLFKEMVKTNWLRHLLKLLDYLITRFQKEKINNDEIRIFLKFIKTQLVVFFSDDGNFYEKGQKMFAITLFLHSLEKMREISSVNFIEFFTSPDLLNSLKEYFSSTANKKDKTNKQMIKNLLTGNLLPAVLEKIQVFLTKFIFVDLENIEEDLEEFLKNFTPSIKMLTRDYTNQVAIEFLIGFLPSYAIPLSCLLNKNSPLGKPSKYLKERILSEMQPIGMEPNDIRLSTFTIGLFHSNHPDDYSVHLEY